MDDAHARRLLERERARIERALADTGPDALGEEGADPLDNADAAPELLDAEIGVGVAQQLATELAAIERAEERLGEGTYGLSVESGEPIPDARLESVPWAERTAAEQSRLESGR